MDLSYLTSWGLHVRGPGVGARLPEAPLQSPVAVLPESPQGLCSVPSCVHTSSSYKECVRRDQGPPSFYYLEARCTEFVHWGGGVPGPSAWTAPSLLTAACWLLLSAAMEVGEAPPPPVLASHEPGFWLSGAPPGSALTIRGSSCIDVCPQVVSVCHSTSCFVVP
uniref:Uncharacterized protein n=1 Tax=Pipistrellus kuhlii TaxID=59472 RepID=A0A7J7RWC2_PIPKU|nr:hypothetical protein mPipKuh1_010227 [Pipistrellus kuhlii]